MFKFELAGTGQAFWVAYPRERDGAKFSVLPKESIEVPEAVRTEVRRRFAKIDGGTENSGPSIPTLSFPLLFAQTARQRVIEALSSPLEAIASVPVGVAGPPKERLPRSSSCRGTIWWISTG